MKLTSSIVSLLSLLSSTVLADSQTFGLVDRNQNSVLHGNSVGTSNGYVTFFQGENTLVAQITDDGKLMFNNTLYAVHQTDGTFQTGSETSGTTGFSIANQYLAFEGNTLFYGVSLNSTSVLSTVNGRNGSTVVLTPISTEGNPLVNFTPGSNSTSTNTTTLSTGNSTSTNSTTSRVSSSSGSSSSTRVSTSGSNHTSKNAANVLVPPMLSYILDLIN